MHDESTLTVCTVSYGHAAHIGLSWKLASLLNSHIETRMEWLIAENAPVSHPQRLKGDERPFRHFPGHFGPSRGASDQHAQALNVLLRHVSTRFVLVLDPDFYILRRNWIDDVIAHMRANGLAFFGAPWHPRFTENYRYFPAVHCMFIDRSRIPMDALDFRPVDDDESESHAPRAAVDERWATIVRKLRFEHRRRRPWDTGTRIFNRFGRDPAVRSECLLPYYRPREHGLGNDDPLSLKNRLLELVLPDDRCYVPKRKTSFTTRGFAERELSALALPIMWEQQFWRDAPFGLHIRGSFGSAARDSAHELEVCKRAIADLCPGTGLTQ